LNWYIVLPGQIAASVLPVENDSHMFHFRPGQLSEPGVRGYDPRGYASGGGIFRIHEEDAMLFLPHTALQGDS
jgi:hypothetical protein